MSENQMNVAPKDTRNALRQRALIFFIYMIFGPPIGGLMFITGFIGVRSFEAVRGAFSGAEISEILMFPFSIFLLSLWGYVFGGVQAALTGLILAVMSDARARFSYGLAVLATIPPSALITIYLAWKGAWALQLAAILAGVSVLAALSLRFLFRKRFGRG